MKRQLIAAATVAVTASGAAYAIEATSSAASLSGAAKAGAKDCPTSANTPKRQLRGMWISTASNIDWPSRPGLTPKKQQAEYRKLLDAAVRRNFNAVFLQVRPASDAVYKSSIEPWSAYLTGTAGKDPGWDPLPFLTAEAHKRGLEFHAWFNPYRAAMGGDTKDLPASAPARRHPEWIVKYGDRLYYNPGLPAVRDHVTKVIKDVVTRYDIDGVHFDDYFYPYPIAGKAFGDAAAYKKYGNGAAKADWRRGNVNQLVAQVGKAVHAAKPYVKFGISPFGIWRNKAQDPAGSKTAGMSAYDSIYADAKAWIKAGSVDYVMPQIYWNTGFKIADYKVLVPWWAQAVRGSGVDLYIGQALYRVPDWKSSGELPSHLTINRAYPEVKGDVYFSARQVAANPRKVMDALADSHYKRPALIPLIKGFERKGPGPVKNLRDAGGTLTWTGVPGARAYAIYRTAGASGCATADGRNLVAVTTASNYVSRSKGIFHVTALDRLGNESAVTSTKLPLP